MTTQSPSPSALRAAVHDPMLRVGGVLLVLTGLPLALPGLSADTRATYYSLFPDPALLAFLIVATTVAARRATDVTRRFWYFVAAAHVAWLLLRALVVGSHYGAVFDGLSEVTESVIVDLLYGAYYLFLALALELLPHRSRPAGERTARSMNAAGAILFAFFLIVYFVFIPSALNPDAYRTYVSSLMLFVVLDAYLCVRLWDLMRDAPPAPWDAVYRWLFITVAIWLGLDITEALLRAEVLEWQAGAPVDLLWLPPYAAMMIAARLPVLLPAAASHRSATARAAVDRRVEVWGGPLAVYVVALPVLHFAAHAAGWLDPASEPARDLLVLTAMLVLAPLAVVYQHRVEADNRRLQAEQEAASRQLLQVRSMEAVGQLSGGIAHEFNNLLTVIQANAALIQRFLTPDHQARPETEEILATSRHGAELVRKLLAVGRQEGLRVAPLDLRRILDDLSTTLRRLIPENIEIRRSDSDAPPPVLGNESAIVQTLINLVTNARDAMPDGGTIEIGTEVETIDDARCHALGLPAAGEYLRLSVRDTGTGMSERVQQKLFQPFFTTKPPGLGTGLGLAFILGLTHQQQGTITVLSEVGRGTEVRVYLPVATDAPAPSSRTTPNARRGSETVLIVEDQTSLRQAARRVLTEYGYTVIEAADGEAALAAIRGRAAKVDLVLSDVVMPRMGGAGLHAELRTLQRPPKMLFMSGHRPTETKLDPAVPFLPKPWTAEELVAKVREVLDSRG